MTVIESEGVARQPVIRILNPYAIARVQQNAGCNFNRLLRAVDDQDLVGADREPAQPQVAGDRGPVLRATAMGLVAQQRLKVAGRRQLPQGAAQQVGLAGRGSARRLRETAAGGAGSHGAVGRGVRC